MARIVTGIKPTGTPHLGNYLGMIRPALELASEHEAYYFVADHHALNTTPEPDALHQRSIEIAATLLALGLEPSRTALYRQSAVPEVFELASLLAPVTPKGLLNRAHAYKAIVAENARAERSPDAGVNMGLFTYPSSPPSWRTAPSGYATWLRTPSTLSVRPWASVPSRRALASASSAQRTRHRTVARSGTTRPGPRRPGDYGDLRRVGSATARQPCCLPGGSLMRHRSLLVLLVVLMVVSLAIPASAARGPDYHFDPDAPLGPLVAGSPQPLATIEAEGVETVQGDIAGAVYVGQKPDDWNGELVVWAHGYRGEGELLYVDPPPVRQWLLDQGYAWIASSYRRNSYDPGIGVMDTKNVTARAGQLWGQPDHTYLAGVSMGGHVTASAIERFPNLYDGALPACGVMADVELFDYFLDYNLGAAAFAGLDAGELTYPDDDWVDDEVVDIKQALSWSPDPASWAFALTEAGSDFKDFVEVRSGGRRGAIYDVAWSYWHVAGDGDFFFDLGEGDGTIANRHGIVGENVDTVYADYGEEFSFLDDDILRVEAANRVRRSKGHKPAPLIDGDPSIPVLSIHTIGDLFVPIEMQLAYAQRVADNGKSDLLVQRAVREVGHCTFSDTEWETSFDDLFDWVESGTAPAGEDLVEDIAEPLLGCDWTQTDGTETQRGGIRLFDGACP